jgi:hypothetical protein
VDLSIDRASAKSNYISGASNNAEKLVKNYTSTTGKVDAARSDSAEKLWAEQIQKAIAAKTRQKALAKVSESDMNAAMTARGASAYRTGTAAGADKQARNVEPYYAALDGLEGKYPAKTSDPMANLMNRAGLVVKTLSDLKKRVG